MAKMKVLITVKTYPSLSNKYEELVCTAGFTENGDWIRIYPIQFRKKEFEQRYKKYEWIEVDLVKNTSDFRKESYRPVAHDTPITVLNHIDTKNNWQERKNIVLAKPPYEDLEILIEEAKNKDVMTSLAVFKPTKIKGLKVEAVEREWNKETLDNIKMQRETNLFGNKDDEKEDFNVIDKLPYKFSYTIEDCNGKESTMMIEDWEIGQLFWNSLKNHKKEQSGRLSKVELEQLAIQDVRRKYEEEFLEKCDIYLFLGTTRNHHFTGRNPFVIIGVFYPRKDNSIANTESVSMKPKHLEPKHVKKKKESNDSSEQLDLF